MRTLRHLYMPTSLVHATASTTSLVHANTFWVGVGGVGGMITFLGLAHMLECGRWVGWVGWVGGVGGMLTFLGLAHIVVYGCGGMGGVR